MTSRYPGACPAPAVSVVLSVYRQLFRHTYLDQRGPDTPATTRRARQQVRPDKAEVSGSSPLTATPGDTRPNGPEQLDDHLARVRSTTSSGVGTPLPSSASSRPIAAFDPSSNSP